MESKVLVIKQQQTTPPMTVVVGSGKHFKGVPEPGDNYSRPLMVNAWSQTTGGDFSYLTEIEQQDQQSQREQELVEKIKVLEENLKAHADLLSQIHATSARTSALLGQQPHLTYPSQENAQKNKSNTNNLNHNSRVQQISPRNINSDKATPINSVIKTLQQANCSPINSVINPLQQVNCSPADSVKYTIIAESPDNHNGEPIEIHLAEDDGAINLSNSNDSGRLEICLAPEENVDIKNEHGDCNTTTTERSLITTTTPNGHQFIKKRKLADNYILNNDDCKPSTSRQIQQNLLKTPKIEHNNKNANDVHISTISMHDSTSSSHNVVNGGAGEQNTFNTQKVMVSLGPNNTRIPIKAYENISWSSASIATRRLLTAIFDRNTLATHSMTGKPSPAFKDHGKPLKEMLDPLVISDIIFTVTRKCKVSEKEVRNAITTKCADENKMMKLRMNKRTPMKEINKENVVQ